MCTFLLSQRTTPFSCQEAFHFICAVSFVSAMVKKVFCFCFCFLRLKCKNNLWCTLIPVVYIEVLDSNHSPTRNPLECREASLNISESPLLRQVRQKCPLDFTSLLQMCYWDTEFLVTYWRQIAQQYDERRALRLCPRQQFFHLSFPHCCWGCTKAVGTFFLFFFN